jgi:hypothetical protein
VTIPVLLQLKNPLGEQELRHRSHFSSCQTGESGLALVIPVLLQLKNPLGEHTTGAFRLS